MNAKRITALAVTVALTLALFGWGTLAGAEEVMGIIAKKGAADIEVMEQPNPNGKVTVAKVVAPADSWVVIHLTKEDGTPGERLGLTRVRKGVTKDVVVKIKDVKLTDELIAMVHMDRGDKGEFEYDMKKPEHSPDKPYFVAGMEMAMEFKAGAFGVDAGEGEAAVEVADQPGAKASLTVAKAVAPTNAWIVVHLNDDGMPGERVGLQAIPAGLSRDVKVALDPKIELTDELLVAVHADRGTPGTFDYDMEDKLGSADQPFFADGMEVSMKSKVGGVASGGQTTMP